MENTVAIKDVLSDLYLAEKQLTAGQFEFIKGCKRQFARNKTLSEKQLAALNDIKRFLPAQDVRFSGYVADNWNNNDKTVI